MHWILKYNIFMNTKLTILILIIIVFSGFIACQKDKNKKNINENLSIDQLMGKKFNITNPPALNFENALIIF